MFYTACYALAVLVFICISVNYAIFNKHNLTVLNCKTPYEFSDNSCSFQFDCIFSIIFLIDYKIEETPNFWYPVNAIVQQDIIVFIIPLGEQTGL